MDDHRKTIRAWCLYDFANSAYANTIQSAVFGPFYRSLVVAAGFAAADATAFWAYTNSASFLLVSLLGPLLGAMADYSGRRKRFLGFFVGLGVICTASFIFINEGEYLFASLLFLGGTVGFGCSEVFYDSFLPFITRSEREMDSVSSAGYALGYLGGGLLLAINAWWMLSPQTFGMPDLDFALRASFISVAVWWAAFSVPMFRRMPADTPRVREAGSPRTLAGGFQRLARTFRHIRRHRQLLIFLVAFWMYTDAVWTVQKMATAYGHELGFQMGQLVLALLLANFIGFPATYLYGHLAGRFGAKPMVLFGIGVYVVICVFGFYIREAWHFYVLAGMVGLVQGGLQALSRSIFGSMVPKTQSAEFFGFFSTSSRFAGIFGPLIFGVVGQATGSSSFAIFSLVFLFLGGGVVLTRVDIQEGVRLARLEDAELREDESLTPSRPAEENIEH